MPQIKWSNGTVWNKPKAIKQWSGSQWVQRIGRYWNGSSWIDCISYFSDGFSEIAPLPGARSHAAVAALGNDVYVVNGNSGKQSTNYCYNTLTNTWSIKAPDTERASSSAIAREGKLLVIGGYYGENNYNGGFNREYDPASNTWTNLANMSPRQDPMLALYSGEIFAAGYKTLNQKYNRLTNTWTNMQSIPTSIAFASWGQIERKLYVLGAESLSVSYTFYHYIYNPETNTWSSGATLSNRKYWSATLVFGTRMHCVGGMGESYTDKRNSNDAYDSITNSWSFYSNYPIKTAVHKGAVAANGSGYLFGGLREDSTYIPISTSYKYN